jgi:hypothetical protein
MRKTAKWILGAMALTASPALAGPRDDVYAGSARCAGIADDKAWLNCFYGSAQPMRSHLGLPPAPAFQTQLVPGSGGAPAPAYAPSPQVYVPRTASAVPAGPPPMPESDSGFGHLFGKVKPVVNALHMTDYSFDHDGYFTVTLEDGEVWQQSRAQGNMAKWKLPAGSYVVSVLPGVLGSFDMKVRGIDGYFKVHRLR